MGSEMCIRDSDIRMPVMDGLAATRALAGPEVTDPIPVVVITTFDLDEYVYAALHAGARGFLLKNAGPTLLGEAVHAAARGDALIDPNVTVRLIEAFAGSAPQPPTSPSPARRHRSPIARRTCSRASPAASATPRSGRSCTSRSAR